MKKLLILTFLFFSSFYGFSQHRLFRYYNSRIEKYYYTTDQSEFGGGREGWQLEGSACLVYTAEYRQGGVVPLFRYYNPNTKDFLYTTKASVAGNSSKGYSLQKAACYVYNYRARGAMPLLRYFNRKTGTHFYTIDRDEMSSGRFNGFQYEGNSGYVFPNEN